VATFLAALLCAAILASLRGAARPPSWVAVALLLALGGEQVAAARMYWRLGTETEFLARGADVADVIGQSTQRIYSPSYSIGQQVAAARGLELADGIDPSQITRYSRFLETAGGFANAGYSVTLPPFPADQPIETAHAGDVPNARLLGLLNVGTVVAGFPLDVPGLTLQARVGDSYVYHNTLCLPRAFLVHSVVNASGEAGELAALQAVDPATTAVLPAGATADLASASAAEDAGLVERRPNRLSVVARNSTPALLVLSEVWAPGWSARVDGRAAPVLRVDSTLRGVHLATVGSHLIELHYAPVSVTIGAVISAIAVLGLVLWAIRTRRTAR
jgi:hypothetical protein